jgi:hypothetical protein
MFDLHIVPGDGGYWIVNQDETIEEGPFAEYQDAASRLAEHGRADAENQ